MSSLKARQEDSATTPQRQLHLDKRIEQILAAMAADASGDDLLTTAQEAAWLGVSKEWLEVGRAKGYGPKFVRLGEKLIRYKRSDTLKFLQGRLRVHSGHKG